MSLSQNERNALLWYAADELDIAVSHRKRAEERYSSIGNWLRSDKSNIQRWEPEIYPQGSILLGTVIKPFGREGEYDIDLVCNLNTSREKITQEHLKTEVRKAVDAYAAQFNMNNPESNRHCVTLNYKDEQHFKMDVVPAVPATDEFYRNLLEKRGSLRHYRETAITITDNRSPHYRRIAPNEWLHSNPKAFKTWFDEVKSVELGPLHEDIIKAASGTLELLPQTEIKVPLQAVIQLLKRHRDMQFGTDKEKPSSIIITTLAGLSYGRQTDLVSALNEITISLNRNVDNAEGKVVIPNPVDPEENLARKWNGTDGNNRKTKFTTWYRNLQRDVSTLLTSNDKDEVLRVLGVTVGEDLAKSASFRLDEERKRQVAAGKGWLISGLGSTELNIHSRPRIEVKESRPWSKDL